MLGLGFHPRSKNYLCEENKKNDNHAKPSPLYLPEAKLSLNNISFHLTKGASHHLEKGPQSFSSLFLFVSLLKSYDVVMAQDECWLWTWEAKNVIKFDVKHKYVCQNIFDVSKHELFTIVCVVFMKSSM